MTQPRRSRRSDTSERRFQRKDQTRFQARGSHTAEPDQLAVHRRAVFVAATRVPLAMPAGNRAAVVHDLWPA